MCRIVLFLYLFLSISFLNAQSVTHGPIVGAITPTSARVFLFTDTPTSFTLELSDDANFASLRSFPSFTDTGRSNSTIIPIDSLAINTPYYHRVRIGQNVVTNVGSFKTFPCEGETGNYTFLFGSCQNENFTADAVYQEMLNHPADLFLQIGDWGYPDNTDNMPSNNDFFPAVYERVVDSYKDKYNYQNMRNYLQTTGVAYVWDDHDYVNNNSSRNTSNYLDIGIPAQTLEIPYPPGTRRNAIKGYYEFFPGYAPVDSSEGIFHKFRMGNMEFFMLDNRAARSPIADALVQNGNSWEFIPPPGHSIIGPTQKQWLLENLKKSTATWKFVITATAFNQSYKTAAENVIQLPQLAGLPLAAAILDSWSGYPEDADTIIALVQNNNIDGVVMLSGDTHTTGIDDGSNGGLPEVMAGCLSQTNSALITTVPLLAFGVAWSEGGQGMSNANTKDSFGKIRCQGDDQLTLEIIDEDGDLITDHTMQSCSFLTGLTFQADSVAGARCNGEANGYAKLTAAGGTPPYSYSFDGDNYQSSTVFNTLTAGRYRFAVRDNGGCTKELCIEITEPTPFDAQLMVSPVSCAGGNDGSAEVTLAGGVTPYTYSWITGQSTTKIDSLIAGSYLVNVQDANGCLRQFTFPITEPDSLDAGINLSPISCDGVADGGVILNPTGGNAPYSVLWADGSTQLSRNGLSPNNYSFELTDDEGCTYAEAVSFTNPDTLVITASITADLNASGTGEIALKVVGGSAPYTYLWLSDNSTQSSLSGLNQGTYSAIVEDANGCSQVVRFSVPLGTSLNSYADQPFTVYPNPATSSINIDYPEMLNRSVSVSLFTAHGKQIVSTTLLLDDKTSIDVSYLDSGLYFLVISTGDQKNTVPVSISPF